MHDVGYRRPSREDLHRFPHLGGGDDAGGGYLRGHLRLVEHGVLTGAAETALHDLEKAAEETTPHLITADPAHDLERVINGRPAMGNDRHYECMARDTAFHGKEMAAG